jgi:hypothetical protein
VPIAGAPAVNSRSHGLMTWHATSAVMSAYAVMAIAACDPGPSTSGDPETEISEIAQGLTQVSITTTRSINATASTLDDWGGRQIDPAIVIGGTLTVRYCQEHFPAGSAALANLVTALDAYSAVAGVAIPSHRHRRRAWDLDASRQPGNVCGAEQCDLHRLLVRSGPGGLRLDRIWFVRRVTPKKCTQAHTYLNGNALLTDSDFFNADDAPSVGVFMHELGHVFGMQHINEAALLDGIELSDGSEDVDDMRADLFDGIGALIEFAVILVWASVRLVRKDDDVAASGAPGRPGCQGT